MTLPAPMRFTTIDPGLPGSGYAMFENGVLKACGLLRVDLGKNKPSGIVPRICAQHHLLQQILFKHGYEGWPVVGERMIHRPMPRFAKGKKRMYIDPQDLINLNALSGRLASLWVSPNEWKGTASAENEQSMSESLLSEAELALVMAVMPDGRRKEAWSAVGIGLSLLRRGHTNIGWGNWS